MITTHPLHERALSLTKSYMGIESKLIECLQKIDEMRVFETLGYTSLHRYTVGALGLTDAQAYMLIGVARKCAAVPELKAAIDSGTLSASKAKKIVSVITKENSQEWIQKAVEFSCRDLEKEVANVNPDALIPEKLQPVSQNRIKMTVGITPKIERQVRRAKELVASKTRQPCSIENMLEVVLEEYLSKPIVREIRSLGRTQKSERKVVGTSSVSQSSNTGRISDRLRRQALNRDRGQCRHLEPNGRRCANKTWVEVHHRLPLSEGGQHVLENLTTLCTAHHKMIHDHEGRRWQGRQLLVT